MAAELLVLRLVLQAPVEAVAEAVDRALQGEPGSLEGPLPMPEPISEDWKDFIRDDCKFGLENIVTGAQQVEKFSCSLGLRPMSPRDEIFPLPAKDAFEEGAFEVRLHGRYPSRVRVLGRWSMESGKGFRFNVDVAPSEQLELSQICEVKATSSGTQLIRSLLCEGGFMSATLRWGDFEDGTVKALRLHMHMLEMEARAWASCHKFPLIEVWRGLRENCPWAQKGAENSVAAYRFGPGHAAAAAAEVWPLFDPGHCRSLAEALDQPRPHVQLQGALQEGNVQVEAFAYLLDRVCRRGVGDIFRRFVDLGSGRGLAVLIAHALFPFRDCVGVEICKEFNDSARSLAKRYADTGLAKFSKAKKKLDPTSMFVEGDLRDFDWSDASVAFANCVTWPVTLVAAMARKALRLRVGAVLLTSKRFPNDVMRGFDFRGEACMGDWTPYAVELWAYQRI
ncbi:unnamed protein product [Effrenium voratum]|nr:unnamed protein product [Effrenium voratum]